jgi:hypothetical protein
VLTFGPSRFFITSKIISDGLNVLTLARHSAIGVELEEEGKNFEFCRIFKTNATKKVLLPFLRHDVEKTEAVQG